MSGPDTISLRVINEKTQSQPASIGKKRDDIDMNRTHKYKDRATDNASIRTCKTYAVLRYR